jgi:hypothetical protein
MAPSTRCDEILRLIDQVLAESAELDPAGAGTDDSDD